MTGRQPRSVQSGIPDELQDTVADRLKRSLRYAGLSNHEMADYMQCHRNTIGSWVRGKARMRPVFIRVWADRTGVPAEWIRTGKWPKGAE
jgi:hypothetical protein